MSNYAASCPAVQGVDVSRHWIDALGAAGATLAPGACLLYRISERRGDKSSSPSGYRHKYLEAVRLSRLYGNRNCGCRVVVTVHDGGVVLRPALCKRWRCGICGPRRAAWLRQQIGRNALKWAAMLTLTLRYCGPESLSGSHDRMMAAWHVLHQAIKRKYGVFGYVWVQELTANRMPHLHIQSTVRISKSWLKRAWLRITGDSFMVDVSIPEARSNVDYMTKYLTKTARRRHGLHQHMWAKSKGLDWEPFSRPSKNVIEVWEMSWWDMVRGSPAAKVWSARVPGYIVPHGYTAAGREEARLRAEEAEYASYIDSILEEVEVNGRL